MSRNSRLAEQIQRELSTLIQMEIKDPRVGMVTVSGLDLSRDMGVAKVFITVLDLEVSEDEELKKKSIAETLKVLEKAGGFLRKQLGRNLILRTIPKLVFHYDGSIEHGRHLSSLIDKAVKSDKAQADNTEE